MRTRKQEKTRLLKLMEALDGNAGPVQSDDERDKLREEVQTRLWRLYIAEGREGKKR